MASAHGSQARHLPSSTVTADAHACARILKRCPKAALTGSHRAHKYLPATYEGTCDTVYDTYCFMYHIIHMLTRDTSYIGCTCGCPAACGMQPPVHTPVRSASCRQACAQQRVTTIMIMVRRLQAACPGGDAHHFLHCSQQGHSGACTHAQAEPASRPAATARRWVSHPWTRVSQP